MRTKYVLIGMAVQASTVAVLTAIGVIQPSAEQQALAAVFFGVLSVFMK